MLCSNQAQPKDGRWLHQQAVQSVLGLLPVSCTEDFGLLERLVLALALCSLDDKGGH